MLSGFLDLDSCYDFGLLYVWDLDYLLSMMGVVHLGSMRSGGSVSYTIEIRWLDVLVQLFHSSILVIMFYAHVLNYCTLII